MVLTAVLSVLGVSFAVTTMRAGPPAADAAAAGPPRAGIDVTGCVIRMYATGPELHIDATHTCPYVTAVEVNDEGRLVVHRKRGHGIQSVIVNPDETLTERGIIAGASWNREHTSIQFFDTGLRIPIRADSPELTGPTANIWITWVS